MLNARRSALLRSLKKPLLLLSLIGVPLTAAGLVSGCGGDGSSADMCFDYTTFMADSSATFSAKVLPIFQRSCGVSSSCHQMQTPANPAQHFFGPAMGTMATQADIDAIFMQTVGVASVDNPDMKVIEPGKPESSFIMYKLDNDLTCSKLTCAAKSTCLGSMPQGSALLSEADRNVIRSWIKNGAMKN